MDVSGKVVLVTGASAGIGKLTAELFHSKGAKVALAARSADKLKEIAGSMKDSFAIQVDMSRRDDVRRMVQETFDHYGRIDCLINNAARGMYTPVEHIDVDDLAYLMSLNVYGPLIAMQAVIPIMRKQGGGVIVNVSSQVSRNVYPNIGPYSSTKCALNQLSLTARKELEADGIAVSIVYPKLTATDFRKNAVPTKAFASRPQGQGQGQMPAIDPPEKVAAVILHVVETGAAEAML